MSKVNWIILSSKDRGNEYGVGSFIKHFSMGLAEREDINVYILDIISNSSHDFKIQLKEGVHILTFPIASSLEGIDYVGKQEKIAKGIARVVSLIIPSGGSNVIHMNYLFQFFIARELKRIIEGRVLFTQHVFLLDEKINKDVFDIEFATYDLVDVIATVTKHGKDHLVKKGVSEEKVKVIYNGIDPRLFDFDSYGEINISKKYGLSSNEKIILYSGRIDGIKGLRFLCSAMDLLIKDYQQVRLLIAGSGDFEKLISYSSSFSSNISFLGFVPFSDLLILYKLAHVGVMPSLQEHCSYVALEMLHCGLPVVASNIGGLKEIFIHNKNALLTEMIEDKSNLFGVSPDVLTLKNQLSRLLEDENLRRSFAKRSIIRALDMFTCEKMIEGYIQTLKI